MATGYSLRAGSHFRCYNRCYASGEAASYESASVRRSRNIDYNNENESLLAGYGVVLHLQYQSFCFRQVLLKNFRKHSTDSFSRSMFLPPGENCSPMETPTLAIFSRPHLIVQAFSLNIYL